MTVPEARLVAGATTKELWWKPLDDGKVALVTHDGSARCPCLDADQRCTVYAVRPYNCRRFVCLRDAGEALEPGGPLGCRNAERRVRSDRQWMRFYRTHQRRAQVWGRAHGWTDDVR